jgi:hypothetical protein
MGAYLLMSSSFFRAFMEHFSGKKSQPPWDEFVKRLIETVVPEAAAGGTPATGKYGA